MNEKEKTLALNIAKNIIHHTMKFLVLSFFYFYGV